MSDGLGTYGDALSEQMNPERVLGKKKLVATSVESESKERYLSFPEVSPERESSPAPFEPKSTEETIERMKRLGAIGSKAITGLRSLFENMKDKIKRRDVEKLEKEIEKLENEKKEELEKAGLKEEKESLEKELNEIKMRRLKGLI